MAKVKKLGCAATLFQCFGSKKKRRAQQEEHLTLGADDGSDHGLRVRFIDADRPLSPLSARSEKTSVCSVASGKSSVYLDALEDDQSLNSLDGSFSSLQIDGQYFFSCRDDASIAHALEGIKLYPPVPTIEPDQVNKYHVSSSDMQSLLYKYQHSDVSDAEEKKEADVQHFVGDAMEHQARVLLSVTKEESTKAIESTNMLLEELKVPQVKVRERGYPGELTDAELDAVKLFKKELGLRDPIYYEIVRSFSSMEKEAYALCRFLRARKFDVEKVFQLLDQAKDFFMVAKENDFYPDLEEALGFSRAVFLSQYPAVFSGNAKNGCPVMYLTAGNIQPEGVKCIVSIDKVDRYFWNDIMHNLRPLIGEGRKMNPDLVRCENINIYDLKGVSRSQITSDTFEMIKVGNQVMTSFPETLHCLLIINAPSWFSLIWSVVKKLIDPRTASKIEVFTSSKSGTARMNELIDHAQIPADYGGSGPSLSEAASGAGSHKKDEQRKIVVYNHLFILTKKQKPQSHEFTIEKGQQLALQLYTRCSAGVKVELFKDDMDKALIVMDIVGCAEEDDQPYSRTIGECAGPEKYTLKLTSNVPGSFLVLGRMNV